LLIIKAYATTHSTSLTIGAVDGVESGGNGNGLLVSVDGDTLTSWKTLLRAQNTVKNVIFDVQANDTELACGSYSNHTLKLITNDTWRIKLDTSGGVFRSNNSSSFSTTSDIRLKENIINADLDICYNNIKNLRLVHYKWKDIVFENSDIGSDVHRLGWIAQELATILPKAVSISNNHGIEDCRSINTDQLYATLYGCTQKLITDKELLETKVQVLEQKNNTLESKVQILEQQIQDILSRLN
jgi:hypothetical protein